MWLLKGCRRCSGDLLKRSDTYGEYFYCLQCGRTYGETHDQTYAQAVVPKPSLRVCPGCDEEATGFTKGLCANCYKKARYAEMKA
jgi:hypothetical protein